MTYYKSTTSSIFDVFTLNPLPYPVLLILALISVFLGLSWYTSYESAVEAAQERAGWALFATPIVLLIIIRWLSSMENPESFFPMSGRRKTYRQPSSEEGASPWGVAALIVLLLVLVQYQSNFHEGWFG